MRVNRRRVWIIAILALLAVIVILAGIKAAQIGTMIKAGKSLRPARGGDLREGGAGGMAGVPACVGTLVAVRGVILSSEVADWCARSASTRAPSSSATTCW